MLVLTLNYSSKKGDEVRYSYLQIWPVSFGITSQAPRQTTDVAKSDNHTDSICSVVAESMW